MGRSGFVQADAELRPINVMTRSLVPPAAGAAMRSVPTPAGVPNLVSIFARSVPRMVPGAVQGEAGGGHQLEHHNTSGAVNVRPWRNVRPRAAPRQRRGLPVRMISASSCPNAGACMTPWPDEPLMK